MKILPQHPEVSRLRKTMSSRRLTARIQRWAVDLQINEDRLHTFWFPSLQLNIPDPQKISSRSLSDLSCC